MGDDVADRKVREVRERTHKHTKFGHRATRENTG